MMKTQFDINKIIKQGKIQNELGYDRALIADRKLRVLSKENPEFKTLRKNLRDLIEAYELGNWSHDSKISKQALHESDLTELIAEKERQFIEKRKGLIKTRLKAFNLNQQDFGTILGHNSKSYISELMNGISPFSLQALIIINQVLNIKLKDLIPTYLAPAERNKISTSINKLENPKLNNIIKEFAIA